MDDQSKEPATTETSQSNAEEPGDDQSAEVTHVESDQTETANPEEVKLEDGDVQEESKPADSNEVNPDETDGAKTNDDEVTIAGYITRFCVCVDI